MIEALLTLARGQAVLDRFEPVDLAGTVRMAVNACGSDAETRGVSIVTALRTATAAGDPTLLDRLTVNLIDNALRYNHPEGTVNITTETRDGKAELIVSNTGPIISQDATEDLIEPFRRLDTTRTLGGEGYGLGLSIVKAIAQAHHGNLTIDPLPGGGLYIRIEFTQAIASN